jgi:hypothetical protein
MYDGFMTDQKARVRLKYQKHHRRDVIAGAWAFDAQFPIATARQLVDEELSDSEVNHEYSRLIEAEETETVAT